MAYRKEHFTGIFRFVEQKVAAGELPTAVFGVTGKDGLIDLRAYGSKPDGSRIKEDDVFPIFSVTKPMVGLAVMQLCEQGRLHPWEPVHRYIPGFETNGKEQVRIWHLLTHSSGLMQEALTDWHLADPAGSTITHEALCGYFTGAGLEFEPGAAIRYNNMAFSVLAEIIRRVSGVPYEQYLVENVLLPLGMRETTFDPGAFVPERIVPVLDGAGRTMPMDGFYNAKLPAGGLLSTASDLLKLGQAMLYEGRCGDNRIVSPLTHRQMTTVQTLDIASGPDAGVFGLTWRLPVNKRSLICRNIYGHNGMGGCMLWIYPEQEAAFVLMTNKDGLSLDNSHIHNVFASCL